jgi:hypothetical protein
MMLPCIGREHYRLSVTDGGAVMELSCRDALPATGQYCSHSKIIKLGHAGLKPGHQPLNSNSIGISMLL